VPSPAISAAASDGAEADFTLSPSSDCNYAAGEHALRKSISRKAARNGSTSEASLHGSPDWQQQLRTQPVPTRLAALEKAIKADAHCRRASIDRRTDAGFLLFALISIGAAVLPAARSGTKTHSITDNRRGTKQ
jgi:hypothetical protein